MTARDVIANAIDHPDFDRKHPIAAAERVLAALQAAPEPVRLELVAMLNPWRLIDTAPFQKTVFVGRIYEKVRVTAYRWAPNSGWKHAHTSEEICFQPTHWLPLPASPSKRNERTSEIA